MVQCHHFSNHSKDLYVFAFRLWMYDGDNGVVLISAASLNFHQL